MVNHQKAIAYFVFPQILPRLKKLLGNNFTVLSYILALVFRNLKILPPGHPVFNPQNKKKYTFVQILGEAASHIQMSWDNIDKILVFFFILAGIVLFFLQAVLFVFSLFISPVFANNNAGDSLASFFVTRAPETDITFQILDYVFGIPGLFNSGNPVGTNMHQGLQAMFQLYNMGMMFVALLLILYFVFVIIAETAQTGVPFGKRFNHLWTPIRLIAALAILIPLQNGMNMGQILVLNVAKLGSSFATNGWQLFNREIAANYIGPPEEMIARPNVPDLGHVAAQMYLTHVCKYAYERTFKDDEENADYEIEAYLVKNQGGRNSFKLLSQTSYQDALDFYKTDIRIRFGRQSDENTRFLGTVDMTCGEIIIPTNTLQEPGAFRIQRGFYEMIQNLWNGDHSLDMQQFAWNQTQVHLNVPPVDRDAVQPTQNFKQAKSEILDEMAENFVTEAIQDQIGQSNCTINQDILDLGWGGSGILVNCIAEKNGSLTAAVLAPPALSRMPAIMEVVANRNKAANANIGVDDVFSPDIEGGEKIEFVTGEKEIAVLFNRVFNFWRQDGYTPLRQDSRMTRNAFVDAINSILGTQGLFDMCANADIHPMAQLASVGRAIVENAFRNIGYSIGVGVLGGVAAVLSLENFGAALQTASSFYMTIAGVGLMAGFLMYYIIPFLPFLYFLFAFISWVQTLFEAMVGIPLWALAHIRMDGDGIAAGDAEDGYFQVFEIFIRPILIVFGLIASIIIFSALVKTFNEIYHIVVANLAGFSESPTTLCGRGDAPDAEIGSARYFRSSIDEFFYTVLYAVIVYLIGLSCFKLVDLIPQQILRWLNSSADVFSGGTQDIGREVMGKASVSAPYIGSQLQQAGASLGKGAQHIAGGLRAALSQKQQ